MSHLVIMDNTLSNSLVQHLLVPLLQAFWLGDLLVRRVTVEDIIISFTGWTGPDMTCCIPETGREISSQSGSLAGVMFEKVWTYLLPQPLDILQVSQQDLVVDNSSEVSRFKEVHAVQIWDVHSSLIGRGTVWAVLLNVHAEKTHICSVDVLERKQGFHPVREGLRHLSGVHKPQGQKNSHSEKKKSHQQLFPDVALP